MAHLYRAQVSIRMDTGLPEDAVVNTTHWDADDDTAITEETRLDHIRTRLETFYSAIDGVVFPAEVSTTADLKIYKLSDAEPRAPRLTATLPLVANAAQSLPSEVAIVLSFQAARESGEPQARRRGRLYLGPVHQGVVVAAAGGSRPGSATRIAIAAAAAAMRTTPQFGRPKWALFSPTTRLEGSSLEDAMHDVDNGWVDDAFDIQRRRGLAPTARNNWS